MRFCDHSASLPMEAVANTSNAFLLQCLEQLGQLLPATSWRPIMRVDDQNREVQVLNMKAIP